MNTQAFDFASANRVVTDLIVSIFRPLCRILLRYHIPYRRVADLLKWVYVQEAWKQQGEDGPCVSRIALQTSLCRKEVSRILKEKSPPTDAHPRRHERIASIVSGWRSDPRFRDEQGKAAVLSVADGDSSFRELVRIYGADIGHTAICDEMVKAGIAEVEEGKICLMEFRLPEYGFVISDLAVAECVAYIQSRWLTLADDLDKIPALAINGPFPSLSALVTEFQEDVDPDIVLEELAGGAGTAKLAPDGKHIVFANRRYFGRNPTTLLQSAGRSAGHFLRTLSRNLARSCEERHLQRETTFHLLRRKDRERLHEELELRWEELKKRLMSSYEPLEWNDDVEMVSTGMGVYFFEEQMPERYLPLVEAKARTTNAQSSHANSFPADG